MAEPEPETAPSFLGKECRLLSPSGSWRECTVVEDRPGEVKVHYDGFDSQHDEWIGTDSPRLRWVGKISDAEVAAWDAKDGVGGANMEWKVNTAY